MTARAILISGVVVLDTLGVAGQAGGQAIVWLALLAALFVLPYALIVGELGSAFPGGPYTWVRLAFGRPAGALCAVLYWIAQPIWVGGTLAIVAVAVLESRLADLGSGRYAVAALFVWLAVGGSFLGTRWIALSGALVRVALLLLLTVSAVAYAISNGVHGIPALTPTTSGLAIAVPLLVLGLLGLELPTILDHPGAVLRSSLTAGALYAVPLVALLVVLPVHDRSGIGGFVDAVRAVFTVYGGDAGSVLVDVAAVGFVYALLSGGAIWLAGGNRVIAAAAADRAIPGVVDRRVAGILSGLVASAVLALTYAVASGHLARYLAAMVAVASSTVLLAYLLVFPSLIRLRRVRPDTPRPLAVPGGRAGAWVCSLVPTAVAIVAACQLIYPGAGLAQPDALLPASFAGLRDRYEQCVALPLAGCLALALVAWLLAAREQRVTT